jgi:hypothetical protein
MTSVASEHLDGPAGAQRGKRGIRDSPAVLRSTHVSAGPLTTAHPVQRDLAGLPQSRASPDTLHG